MRQSEIYRDLLIPIGARWIMGAQLLRDPDQMANIGTFRSDRAEPFAGESVKLFERLIPHLQRAARLQLRLRKIAIEREAADGALDHLAVGVTLVDGALQARGECRRGGGPDRTGGLHPGGTMALPRPSGKRPLVATVAPLRRRSGLLLGDAGTARPAAVLFVADLERQPTEPAQRLSRLYGLTPREAQLVANLVAGRSLEAAAEEMRITRESARGYLKQAFIKTCTSRQAELVALLLGALTPIA